MATARVEALARKLADMKTTIEAKVAELDGRLGLVGGEIAKLPALEAKTEGVEKWLTEYTESLAINQAKTTEVMMSEVMKMASQKTEQDVKIAQLQGAIETLVSSGTGGGGTGYKKEKEFFDPTKMQPDMLKDQASWRKWKTDVEDMLECSVPGMGLVLDKARKEKTEVGEEVLDSASMWSRRDRLYRYLRRYTEGEGRKTVEGARDNNGWDAWRRLHSHFEQGMANQKAQARQALANYMTRKAMSVQESRTIMNELDRTVKKYAEIVGEEPPTDYIQAIIERILDATTMQYMVGYDVDGESDSKAYRDRVSTYLSTMCYNDNSKDKANAMDLDNMDGWASTPEKSEGEPAEEPTAEWLGAFQGSCWTCGGYGHSQNQCPNKGKGKTGAGNYGKGKGKFGKAAPPPPPKGKGKDNGGYGPAKGKGKGKGPCWICGGQHMQRDCPQGQGGGKGYGNQENGYGKGGIRALHCLETVMPVASEEEVIEFTIPASDWIPLANNGDLALASTEPPPAPEADWLVHKSRTTQKREKKMARKIGNDACCVDGNCTQAKCHDLGLGVLETISPVEEVNAVGEWEELMMAVDSGATETVVSGENAKSIPTVSGPASKSGVKYSTANGEVLDNEGEKHMFMSSAEGVNRAMTAQVTEVNKPLLSVSKMVKAGNTVIFSPEGSYIYDGYTGETMSLEESKGLYWLKVWIKSSSGF